MAGKVGVIVGGIGIVIVELELFGPEGAMGGRWGCSSSLESLSMASMVGGRKVGFFFLFFG